MRRGVADAKSGGRRAARDGRLGPCPSPTSRSTAPTDDDRYLATDHLVWFDEPDDLADRRAAGRGAARPAVRRRPSGRRTRTPTPASTACARCSSSCPRATAAALVPMAGLTWVGVHPDHRRRGRAHRDAAPPRRADPPRGRGALRAARERAGRSTAGTATGWRRRRPRSRSAAGTTFNAPGLDDAAAAHRDPARERHRRRPGRPGDGLRGARRRGPARGGRRCGELLHRARAARDAAGAARQGAAALPVRAVRDGVDVGLAAFRRTHKWEQHRPQGTLEVFALIGEPAARLAMLRRLVDFDLMGTVKLPEIGDRRPAVAVARAAVGDRGDPGRQPLAARSSTSRPRCRSAPTTGTATWSSTWSTRWRPGRRAGGGSWSPAARAGPSGPRPRPTPTLPVAALGSAYLGGTNLVALQRAGLLPEVRPGAVTELWRAFRTDLPPTTAIGF